MDRAGPILLVASVSVACSAAVLSPPLVEGDQSLLMVLEGAEGPRGIGCDLDSDCSGLSLDRDNWELLVIIYDRPLAELGIPRGEFVPMKADVPNGAPFPEGRALTASSEAKDLRAIAALAESDLYHRYRMPKLPCPTWSLRWSAKAGSALRIAAVVAMDQDRVLAFAETGEIVEVRPDDDRPRSLAIGPPVVAAVSEGLRALAMTSSGSLARIDELGHVELVPGAPVFPRLEDLLVGNVEIAGAPESTLYLQSTANTEAARTSTVWRLQDGAWSLAWSARSPLRAKRGVQEGLTQVGPSRYFSSEIEGAALSVIDGVVARPVASFPVVDFVYQVRRLDDHRIFAVARRNEEVTLHVGDYSGPEVVWEPTISMPNNDVWRCSSADGDQLLCVTPYSATILIGGRSDCADSSPSIPKDARRVYPLGDGWLIESYENERDTGSLHLIARE